MVISQVLVFLVIYGSLGIPEIYTSPIGGQNREAGIVSEPKGSLLAAEDKEYDSMHPLIPFILRHKNQQTNSENGPNSIISNFQGEQEASWADKEEGSRGKRDLPFLSFAAKNVEKDADYWRDMAQATLKNQLKKNKLNKNVAKNVILFMGDGMSIPTLAATRIYLGGEEKVLSFEEFPYSGLSKTYCANTQVADSACSATAYLSGVKANYGTIGLSADVDLNDCLGEANIDHHVPSIAKWAQDAGMSTGVITTTQITHASPAGVYAHTSNRNWEYDGQLQKDGGDPNICTDIAKQLIYGDVGKNLKVALGGGRSFFIPNNVTDIDGNFGKRTDGVNLIDQWKIYHKTNNHSIAYVETKAELLMNDTQHADYLFGLFDSLHLPFHLDAELTIKPTLAEMVDVALNILERDDRGYFLFIEGGRIDHGHHYTQAIKALDETVEFAKAVDLVKRRTSEENTLIVVTADHSHTMSISGYSSRGNDILGINDSQNGLDQLPYATLSYANGPGYNTNLDSRGHRKNLQEVNMLGKEYRFPATVPLEKETHGGDDVPVYASGPWAHLFTGTIEQHVIPHAMAYSTCIGSGATACDT